MRKAILMMSLGIVMGGGTAVAWASAADAARNDSGVGKWSPLTPRSTGAPTPNPAGGNIHCTGKRASETLSLIHI